MRNNKTRKIVFIALLVSQAIILNYFESILGLNLGIPGAKLGLANIITLLSIYTLSYKSSLLIVITRSVLIAAMFGSLYTLAYSLAGGILSLTVMFLLVYLSKQKVSIFAVSILGAISHNVGQLFMASLVISNVKIFVYLPFLVLIAVPTGLAIALTSKGVLKYLVKNNFVFN